MAVFLDTSVFIHAAGDASAPRAACVDLLHRVAAHEVDARTSAEVVQEIHHVFRRRGRLADGVALGREVVLLFPDLLPISRADIVRSGDILMGRPQLSPRDALHAATALNNGISAIVSTDSDLDQVEGLTRVDPRRM